MIAQKFTESIADVMRYIVNVEMGGEVDSSHRLFRTYLDLRDIFENVKGHNETLDLQTHDVFRNPYSFEESDKDRYYNHPEEKFNRNWYDSNQNKQ